jgi:hypothetical protein
MTTALEGVRGQRHVPAALYPREGLGTHCTGGWLGPGTVWTGAENLAPPGFDPQTVQPVTSHYTDWATQPTFWVSGYALIFTFKWFICGHRFCAYNFKASQWISLSRIIAMFVTVNLQTSFHALRTLCSHFIRIWNNANLGSYKSSDLPSAQNAEMLHPNYAPVSTFLLSESSVYDGYFILIQTTYCIN